MVMACIISQIHRHRYLVFNQIRSMQHHFQIARNCQLMNTTVEEMRIHTVQMSLFVVVDFCLCVELVAADITGKTLHTYNNQQLGYCEYNTTTIDSWDIVNHTYNN